MPDRYSKKDILPCARRLATLLKVKKVGNCWRKGKDGGNEAIVGCWEVSYNPTYGGAVIEEVMSKSGGVTNIFGDRRQKPAEFCEQIWFTERVLEYKSRRRKK